MRIERGATRWVLVTRWYAFKFPALYSWPHFLRGLLCNIQERIISQLPDDRILVPIMCLPGGWLNIYPTVQILTEEEYASLDISRFKPTKPGDTPLESSRYNIPVEDKSSSFGWYKDKVVAIDYGS